MSIQSRAQSGRDSSSPSCRLNPHVLTMCFFNAWFRFWRVSLWLPMPPHLPYTFFNLLVPSLGLMWTGNNITIDRIRLTTPIKLTVWFCDCKLNHLWMDTNIQFFKVSSICRSIQMTVPRLADSISRINSLTRFNLKIDPSITYMHLNLILWHQWVSVLAEVGKSVPSASNC